MEETLRLTDDEENKKSWKRSGSRRIKIVIFLLFFICVYFAMVHFFRTHYFFKTTINGESASLASVEEMKQTFAEKANGFSLTVIGSQSKDVISGEDVGLLARPNEKKLLMFIKRQNPYIWPVKIFSPDHFFDNSLAEVSKKRVEDEVSLLYCTNNFNAKKPENAKIVYDVASGVYRIKKEEIGNIIDKTKLAALCNLHFRSLSDTINLKYEDCFKKPRVYANNPELKHFEDTLNAYLLTDFTYLLPNGSTRTLTNKDKQMFLSGLDKKSLKVKFNHRKIYEFLWQIADQCNTVGIPKDFTDLRGHENKQISVCGGDYGREVDIKKEYGQLKRDLMSGACIKRNPIYCQDNELSGPRFECDITKGKYRFIQGDSVEKISICGITAEGVYTCIVKEHMANVPKLDISINLKNTVIEDGKYPIIFYSTSSGKKLTTEQQAALDTDSMISAIGDVTMDRQAYIIAARNMYNDLSAAAKKYVSRIDTLEAAEAQMKTIKEEYAQQKADSLQVR